MKMSQDEWGVFFEEDANEEAHSFFEWFGDVAIIPILWTLIASISLALIGTASFVALWMFTACWNIVHFNWLFV